MAGGAAAAAGRDTACIEWRRHGRAAGQAGPERAKLSGLRHAVPRLRLRKPKRAGSPGHQSHAARWCGRGAQGRSHHVARASSPF